MEPLIILLSEDGDFQCGQPGKRPGLVRGCWSSNGEQERRLGNKKRRITRTGEMREEPPTTRLNESAVKELIEKRLDSGSALGCGVAFQSRCKRDLLILAALLGTPSQCENGAPRK